MGIDRVGDKGGSGKEEGDKGERIKEGDQRCLSCSLHADQFIRRPSVSITHFTTETVALGKWPENRLTPLSFVRLKPPSEKP
jgi:hypothetical protein